MAKPHNWVVVFLVIAPLTLFQEHGRIDALALVQVDVDVMALVQVDVDVMALVQVDVDVMALVQGHVEQPQVEQQLLLGFSHHY